MRILLISGIVFVHVPFDPQTSPYLGTYGAFDWLRVFLADSLFRIGVPCLSAISGYLLFRRGLEAFNYRKVVVNKARTVALPFLIWNLGFALVASLVIALGFGDGYLPNLAEASLRELMTHLLAAEDYPVNLPLYFLRDLFICVLMSPCFVWALRRAPLLTLIGLFLVAIVPQIPAVVVLKSSIPFSFSLGIYIALNRIDVKALDPHAQLGTALLFAAAISLACLLYWNGNDYPQWLEMTRNVLSILGAAGFWAMSALLVKSRIGQRLSRTGSLSFWIFCSHYPVLLIFWMVWGKIGGDFYPLYFVLAVATLFPILILSHAAVRTLSPRLYGLLTGGRTEKAVKALQPAQVPQHLSSQQR